MTETQEFAELRYHWDDALAEADSFDVAISRDELEDAVRSGDDVALLLDVEAHGAKAATERQALVADWKRDELERLLRDTGGDTVTIRLHRDDVQRALTADDVEAHGKTAAIAVTAITASLIGAGAASAAHQQHGAKSVKSAHAAKARLPVQPWQVKSAETGYTANVVKGNLRLALHMGPLKGSVQQQQTSGHGAAGHLID
jgi:hypothetical protein